ncbi:MAG: type II secretion system protein J [Acidobacteriota bacterium]
MAAINARRQNNGYSLLEMMVALGIMTSLVLSMLSIISSGLGFHGKGLERIEAQESARNGLDMMVRDVKEGIKVINASGATLTLLNQEGKTVDYYVRTSTLYRRTNGAAAPVANNVYGILLDEVLPGQYDISIIAEAGVTNVAMHRRITK